jgi:hypothetical protein
MSKTVVVDFSKNDLILYNSQKGPPDLWRSCVEMGGRDRASLMAELGQPFEGRNHSRLSRAASYMACI